MSQPSSRLPQDPAVQPSDLGAQAIVLLPTYNEAGNLQAIVAAILAAYPQIHIMVLDDHSPDGTGDIAAAIARKEPRLQVVHRKQKAGLGAAYIDGFRRALKGPWRYVLQMDADFSHPPGEIATLLGHARHYDLVLGSRWIDGGGTRNWPLHRRFISWGGCLYARTVLSAQVRDLTSGFKCFRREVLEALNFDQMHAAGYVFQIEVTYRALQLGFRVHESPILFTERNQGHSKMSSNIFVEAFLRVPSLRFGNLMRR